MSETADAPKPRYTLPRSARLIRQLDFRRVYGRGSRAHGRAMVVIALPRREPGHRLGLSVSKEHGRAVRRNKLKRILREAFRLERPTLPGSFDLVLIPRRRDGRLELAEARSELATLVGKVVARGPEDRERRGAGRRRSGRGRRGKGRRQDPR